MNAENGLIGKDESTNWVARTELIRLLDQCHHYALTLLLAPSGAGKSTLLEQWRGMTGPSASVMVTLTREDSDPARFFGRLDHAIREQVRCFPGLAFNQLCVDAGIPSQRVAANLRVALEQVREPIIIIIDDFDFARSPVIQEVIAGLMLQLPPQIHFVLSARHHPAFSLSRLKLENQLLLLDANDLKLNPEEVDRFARSLLARPLQEKERHQLAQMTQGCAAGIKLALLAGVRDSRIPDGLPSDNSDELVGALVERLLQEMAEASRLFLVSTSILDRLCAPLCDHLLDCNGSLGLLENFHVGEMFLQHSPGMDGWYQYHHLFRRCLRERLEIERPELIPLLHRRAAQWFLENGELEHAMRHAQEAADEAFFIATLCHCCEAWIRVGQFTTLIEWVEAAPAPRVRKEWRLLVPMAAALLFSRQYCKGRQYLEILKLEQPQPGGVFAENSTIELLQIMLDLMEQDVQFELTDGHREVLAGLRRSDVKAIAMVIQFYYTFSRGDIRTARSLASEAKPFLAELGYTYLESYADLVIAMSSGRAGEMLRACIEANDLFVRCTKEQEGQSWINAATAMAVAQYEQNNLERALALTEKVIPVMGTSCVADVISYAYFIHSRVLSLGGQEQRAARLLGDLQSIMEHGHHDRLLSHAAVERARQCFVRHDLSGLDRLIRELGLSESWAEFTCNPDEYSEVWERRSHVVALWLRAHGRLEEAEKVLRTLKRVLEEKGLEIRVLVTTANLAVVRMEQGDTREPMHLLIEKIKYPGQACFTRTVFDEAPGAGAWVAEGLEKGLFPNPDLLTGVFGSVLESARHVSSDQFAGAEASLTDKERQILEYLREGLTNEQISREAKVAVSTTKWHLKNIYSKLGVANRTEAAVRASRD